MFGRALEALCRDNLKDKIGPKKHVMLGEGIQALRDNNIIDGKLFDWSQQLQAFRNLAAHPEDVAISRDDAEDLQTFVYAIVEYVYDLSDRYNEFKERAEARAKKIEKAKKKL